MSTNTLADNIDFEQHDIGSDVRSILEGDTRDQIAKRVHAGLTTAWGLPEVSMGDGGQRVVPTGAFKRKAADDPEWLEETYGTRHPFVAGMAATPGWRSAGENRTTRALESVTESEDPQGRALVDETVIGAAAPVDVDPVITDVQRSAAPELEVVQTVSQPGFSFKYNTLNDRDDPIGFLSESEAAGDLESQFTPQSFTLSDETLDMIRHVGLVKVSDFSQRAMESLDYMDPRETALGQAVISHTLQKAKGFFYGDPTVGAGDQSVEDGDAFGGLARKATDGPTDAVKDKSAVSSGFLEDLLEELTDLVNNSGMTWDRAHFLVSPFFYNAIYEEVTPTIRLDGYDADVEYGPQGIQLSTEMGSAPITPAPNIREYTGLTGVGSNASNGDVFLIDELAVQFRQLAPVSTVPLGRTGLADRVALFEFYQLVDKSQGEHLRWLQNYDIPTGN